MTREEILALGPGTGLDQLVAEKVMGWQKGTQVVSTGFVFQPVALWEEAGGVVQPVKSWSPSTDIVAMWEVVKKAYERGWGINIYGEKGFSWEVEILITGSKTVVAQAETLPLAVCRAVLLAVMEGG